MSTQVRSERNDDEEDKRIVGRYFRDDTMRLLPTLDLY